ncbi:hypothetical protein CDD82_4215 [Ophiocordyceps australis]|uniref:C3H1-type domain-containing protein n=1 Tax=Ophiocordyceps australis TaxID=1399860 RepID=A0A2C5Z947_9HYPO|nr:hypothetical protein CDD82_4215 [Ophiocordyceps australis]
MTICKFWGAGNCRYGNNCRFEHPTRTQPQNRFGTDAVSKFNKYNISVELLENDLTADLPEWILSSYAPGKNAPEQLFGGIQCEQSFEELRFMHMQAQAAGHEGQAIAAAQELYHGARGRIDHALRNSQDAVQFVIDGENRHPNRNDVCRQSSHGAPFGVFAVGVQRGPMAPKNSSFGLGIAAQQGSTFGQPSLLGQRPNAFAAPAFGQTSQPASAFGQPQQSQMLFGQAAQASNSPFGQGPSPVSTFGQPSTLGAKPNPFGAPRFGQPASPSTPGNAFGQPGQQHTQGSPFGQGAQQNTQGSPFGQGAQQNTQASPFGQIAQQNTQGSLFGQPSQLGQRPSMFAGASNTNAFSSLGSQNSNTNNNAPAANPFGNANAIQQNPFATNTLTPTTMAPSPFGQAVQQSSNPFGQQQQSSAPNPFGQATPQASSAFGQIQPPPQTNGFGQAANNSLQNTNQPFGQPGLPRANPFGAPQTQQAQQLQQAQQTQHEAQNASESSPYPPGSSKQHPLIATFSSKGMDGRLALYKGKPVTYVDDKPVVRNLNGTLSRIWFPDGAPAYTSDTELPPEMYDEKTRTQWEEFASSGIFTDGTMPELPPPRECTRWDF